MTSRIINHHGNVEEVSCETCGGEGTVNEFRRFAGEYMAGEFVGVTCPDCDGSGTEEVERDAEQLTETIGDPFFPLKRSAAR